MQTHIPVPAGRASPGARAPRRPTPSASDIRTRKRAIAAGNQRDNPDPAPGPGPVGSRRGTSKPRAICTAHHSTPGRHGEPAGTHTRAPTTSRPVPCDGHAHAATSQPSHCPFCSVCVISYGNSLKRVPLAIAIGFYDLLLPGTLPYREFSQISHAFSFSWQYSIGTENFDSLLKLALPVRPLKVWTPARPGSEE